MRRTAWLGAAAGGLALAALAVGGGPAGAQVPGPATSSSAKLPPIAIPSDLKPAEAARYKEFMRQGAGFASRGECDRAMPMIDRAMAIKRTPDTLILKGDCLAQLGMLVEALATLEEAVELVPMGQDRALERRLATKLNEVRNRVATIVLVFPPEVTAPVVRVDGTPVLPERVKYPVVVNPGEHLLEVSAEGRLPFTEKVTATERQALRLEVKLPLRDAPTPVNRPPAKGVPTGTWILGGTALALTIAGAVSFAMAGSKASDGARDCAAALQCDSGLQDEVHAFDTVALGSWIGAGVALGGALVVFELSGDDAAAPPPAAALRVGPNGAAVLGRF